MSSLPTPVSRLTVWFVEVHSPKVLYRCVAGKVLTAFLHSPLTAPIPGIFQGNVASYPDKPPARFKYCSEQVLPLHSAAPVVLALTSHFIVNEADLPTHCSSSAFLGAAVANAPLDYWLPNWHSSVLRFLPECCP